MTNRKINKGKLSITLVMVIHDEETLIERALKSCAELVNDIVIVHDGRCGDNSLKIARKYTKRIYILPKANSAQPHRPFSYGKARNDWILQLDADEYLSKKLKKELSTLISKDSDIYIFSWPTLYNERYYWGRYKTALFRKSKIYYIGATHEYPKPISDKVLVKKIDIDLIHEPSYNDISFNIFKKKWIRRAKIHAKFLKMDFKKISKWNYSYETWDFPTNIRIKFPIMFGMIVTPLFHFYYGFQDLIRYQSIYMLKHSIFTGVYFFIVFYSYRFSDKINSEFKNEE